MKYKPVVIGERFFRLVVVKDLGIIKSTTSKYSYHYVLCKCDCGNEKVVNYNSLKCGTIKSCGCWNIEQGHQTRRTHGDYKKRLYKIYKGIKKRCYDENCSNYHNYGGRGISVCDEWLNNYIAFKEWSLSHGYTDELTIDRIDVNGNYSPDNCRWVTMSIQNANTRKNKPFEAISPSGEILYGLSKYEFALEHNLNPAHVRSVFDGKQKTCDGWRFRYI